MFGILVTLHIQKVFNYYMCWWNVCTRLKRINQCTNNWLSYVTIKWLLSKNVKYASWLKWKKCAGFRNEANGWKKALEIIIIKVEEHAFVLKHENTLLEENKRTKKKKDKF
jgi:hypothetical protein